MQGGIKLDKPLHGISIIRRSFYVSPTFFDVVQTLGEKLYD